MTKFAKIIDTEQGQIVVMRLSTNEEGEHISAYFALEGGTCNIKAHFGDESQDADEAFEGAEEWVVEQVKGLREQLKGGFVRIEED